MASFFEIKRGDTWRQAFEVVDLNDAPIDLSGCTFWLQVRDRKERVVFDTANEGSFTVDGNWIYLDAGETMPEGRFEFDLKIYFADGTPMTSDTFYLRVVEVVTHAD